MDAKMPHEDHELHMCFLSNLRQWDEVARLAKDAKYFCEICGRAAAKPENLCEPKLIEA